MDVAAPRAAMGSWGPRPPRLNIIEGDKPVLMNTLQNQIFLIKCYKSINKLEIHTNH